MTNCFKKLLVNVVLVCVYITLLLVDNDVWKPTKIYNGTSNFVHNYI